MLFPRLNNFIELLDTHFIPAERKKILIPLIQFIRHKLENKEYVDINFICTHNSRRSHFAQVWAQALAHYYSVINLSAYSGGTETTTVYPLVIDTLQKTGFLVEMISTGTNPIYSIKYAKNTHPVIGYSKKYDCLFNPKSGFAAVLTCSNADINCPFVSGAEQRIPITYIDPKVSDNTPEQSEVYKQRNNQIATEMKYVFSNLINKETCRKV